MPANATRHNLKTVPLRIQPQALAQRKSKGQLTPDGTTKPENSALDNTALLRDEPTESPRTELLSITSTESTGLGGQRQGNDLVQRLVQANAQQSSQQPSPPSNTPQSPNIPNPNHLNDKRTSRKHSKELSSQERERTLASVPARELVHMLIDQEHDAKKMRRIIRLAYQNLEVESKRAEDAERANSEALEKFRLLNESRLSAQQEVRKTVQELRNYKMKLEAAEQEIGRTHERLRNIEMKKEEAENQATRAKDKMRQLNQMRVLDKAREEGRRDGFMEGLKHGHGDMHGSADYSMLSPDEAISLTRSQSDRGPGQIDAHAHRGDDRSPMSNQGHYPGTFQALQPPLDEDYSGAQDGDGPQPPPRESIPMPEPTFFDEAVQELPSILEPHIFSHSESSDPQPDPHLPSAPTAPDLNPNMVPGINEGVKPPPSPGIESYPIDIPTHDQIERHFSINSQKKTPKLKERIRRISEAARSQHSQQQPPPQLQQQQYYHSQQASSSLNGHGIGSSSMPMGMLGLTGIPPGQDPAAPILMSMGMPMRNSGTIPFLQRQPVPQPQFEGMSEKARGKQRSDPLWYQTGSYNNNTNVNGEPVAVPLREDGDDGYCDQFGGDNQGFRSIQLEPQPGGEEITEMVRSTPRSGHGIPMTGPPPPGSTETGGPEFQFPIQMQQQPFQPEQIPPKPHKSHFRTRSISLSLHRPFLSSSSNANHANPDSNTNSSSNTKPWYQRVLPLSVTKHKRQRHNSIDSAGIGVRVAVPVGSGTPVKGILLYSNEERPKSGKSSSNSQAHQSMVSGRTSDFELISNPRTEAANHVRNSIGRTASTSFWKRVLKERNREVRLAMITEEMKRQIEESAKANNAAAAENGSCSAGRGSKLPFMARERAMPAEANTMNGEGGHAWIQSAPDGGLMHTQSASSIAHDHVGDPLPSRERPPRPIRPPKPATPENSSQRPPSAALQPPTVKTPRKSKRTGPSSLPVKESPPPAIQVQSPSVSLDHRSWGAKSELPPTHAQATSTAAPDPPPTAFKPTPPLRLKRRVEGRSPSAKTVITPPIAENEQHISVTYHAVPFVGSDAGEKSHRRSKTATVTPTGVHATTTSAHHRIRASSSEQHNSSNTTPQTSPPSVKRHHSDKPRTTSVTVQPTPEPRSHNHSPDKSEKSKPHRSRTVIPEGVGTGLYSVYSPTPITQQQPLSPKSSKYSRSHSHSHSNNYSPTSQFNTYPHSSHNPPTTTAAKVPSTSSTAHQTNYHTPVSSTSRPAPLAVQPAPTTTTLKLERTPSASSLRSHGSYEHFDPTTYRDPALFANNEVSPDPNERSNRTNNSKSSHGHGGGSDHHHQMSSSSTSHYDYIYKPNPAHSGLGHGNGASSGSHHGHGHDHNQRTNDVEPSPSTPTIADRQHSSRSKKESKSTYYTSAMYTNMSDRYPRRH